MNPPSRIVVGVDGSPAAKAALAWSVQEARRTNASVLALSVCQLSQSSGVHRHELAAAVDALGTTADGVRIDQDVPYGQPGPTLVALSADADLLVVGDHGYHKAGVLVMSSVTTYCLRNARCPVVAVPLEGARHDGPLMLRPEAPVR
ncbi:universal stress protein [Lentzea nigeriaca]|uniref:universal stress protein n=1 Tax=Lentzea nigeriaca TaxID=1128665 RepID=UPI001958282B|nr:universal stress protein [Lentzea nigeriaca]MBM7864633.1 nucleotide-binding universal stress UspA family protein [Lentzea nigeriaca]